LNDTPFMAIAGISTAPGADVEPFYKRLDRRAAPQDWKAWIYLSKPEAELLQPPPAGSLRVETARAGRG
jgi:putative SOS response-associated peptidase YedK